MKKKLDQTCVPHTLGRNIGRDISVKRMKIVRDRPDADFVGYSAGLR